MDSKPFPFLSLPPEIRNQVYRTCLVADGPMRPKINTGSYLWDRRNNDVEAYQPNDFLLRTCRLVHFEASAIFYGENTWSFTDETPHAFRVFPNDDWRPKTQPDGQLVSKWIKHIYPFSILDLGQFLNRIGPQNVANLTRLNLGISKPEMFDAKGDDLWEIVNRSFRKALQMLSLAGSLILTLRISGRDRDVIAALILFRIQNDQEWRARFQNLHIRAIEVRRSFGDEELFGELQQALNDLLPKPKGGEETAQAVEDKIKAARAQLLLEKEIYLKRVQEAEQKIVELDGMLEKAL